MTSDAKPRVLLLLTVDTEEEWDWKGPFPAPPFSTRNVREVPALQALCRRLGLRPTYLVDYAVCDDDESAGHLRETCALGGCEIGAHLHPWCNPPVEEEVGPETSHAVRLPLPLVRRKLQNLAARIHEALGVQPRSFRAGRWGMNGPLLRLLSEEGYRVDSSVHPFMASDEFGYDHAPVAPYWPDYADALAAGPQRQILEVPVSSGFNRDRFDLCQRLHRRLEAEPLRRLHGVGILWQLGLLRRVSTSLEFYRFREVRSCIEAHLRRGTGLVNLFFHSSSLLPGCTPYVASQADVERLKRSLAETVDFLSSRAEVVPCTLSEARDLLTEDL